MKNSTQYAAKIKKLSQGDEDTVPLMGMPGPYLLDLQGYNPAGLAKLLGVPLLILQGERDYLLTTKDFDLWKSGLAGQKNATLKSYPALDRVLLAGQPGQHVAQDVIDDVAKWLNQ